MPGSDQPDKEVDVGSIPDTSGVYQIVCLPTNKVYIGSSIHLARRKQRHWTSLQRGKHDNIHLQRAWNKYGEGAFMFSVLEFVLEPFCTAREQYWINKFHACDRKRGFNIALHTDASMLGRKQSPETIEKKRQANTGKKRSVEAIEKTRQANTGRKQSPEHTEKSRRSNTGRKQPPGFVEKIRQANTGRKQSPEAIEKARQAHIGRKRPAEAIENMRQAQARRWQRYREQQGEKGE
jgi:group I intron endonuclease